MNIPICPVWFPGHLLGHGTPPLGGQPAIASALNPQPLPPGLYLADASVRF